VPDEQVDLTGPGAEVAGEDACAAADQEPLGDGLAEGGDVASA
jgi:hypothetical protein